MTLRIFESVFYKSPIRACSFDNSLAASQNARSYGQTINHRALRICKKRIQKVLMLSSFFLRNSSSYLLSDSYMTNTTYRSQLEILSICKYTINNISNSITSIRTCLVNTDIADHITSILHSNGMNTRDR